MYVGEEGVGGCCARVGAAAQSHMQIIERSKLRKPSTGVEEYANYRVTQSKAHTIQAD